MKKLISLLLALALTVGLVACASTNREPAAPEKEETTETPEVETPEEAPEEKPEEPADDQPATMPEEPADDQPATMPELPAEGEGEAAPEMPAVPEANPEVDELLAKLDQLVAGINDEMMVMNAEVTPDMYEYHLFIPYVEGSIAVTSAPMIGSIPHSVVLMKLAEGTDVAAVAADIEANMDPRKWVCVEAETAYVKTSGQYVLMVLSTADMGAAIEANFETVFGA